MIIKNVKKFQSACKSILDAVDTTTNSVVNETLELKTSDNKLSLNVTNREYFVSIKLDVISDNDFSATVDAKLFLSLISKITTEEVTLTTKDSTLLIKGNGNYKLPMIYDDKGLLSLTPITINNVTSNFVINSDILLSILSYNSKEIAKAAAVKPVQKMYYIDEQGAITFTNGACVNSFNLEQPIKLLLNNKLVKLFKLFSKNIDVQFSLGYDEVGSITQQKVKFESDNISITSVLVNDESLLLSVPVKAIRGRAENTYKYSINVNKDALLSSIDRLLVFSSLVKDFGPSANYATFVFDTTSMTIGTMNDENKEYVDYSNTTIDSQYQTILDLTDIKLILETCQEQYLTISFGDNQAFVISRGNVKNVVPEIKTISK